MEILAWVVAALFAVVAGVLAFRSEKNPYPDALKRLSSELNKPGPLPEGRPEDPPEIARLRALLREQRPSTTPDETHAGSRGSTRTADQGEDPQARALRGLFRYLDEAVLGPLEDAQRDGESRGEVQDAVDALRDLAFYARAATGRPPAPSRENLQAVIQSVTREFALETGTPVKFSGPDTAIPVMIAAERFKDALFLLLTNAGHFGRGDTVQVIVEPKEEDVEIRIRDRGPGFTEEALERAFEPFWSSEADALGLGLHHSRELLGEQGASVRVGNVEGGGAESVVRLPKTR